MCKFCEGDPRAEEMAALLDGGEESHAQIALIVGCKKWEVTRYAEHRVTRGEIAAPSQPESQLGQLCASISTVVDKLTRKRNPTVADLKIIAEFSGQLTQLHKLIEAQQAAAPKPQPKQTWTNSLAFTLGRTARGMTRELARDLGMFIRREKNLSPAIEGACAFLIAVMDDVDRPELTDELKPIMEKFLVEMHPHLKGVINEVVEEKEIDYSGADFFGSEA